MYASQLLYGAAGAGHFNLAGFIVAVTDDGLPPHRPPYKGAGWRTLKIQNEGAEQ
jgi:hypothetical protein